MVEQQSGKTILIYCQHLWGIGHLMRASAIARALSSHRVHFVLGGRAMGKSVAFPGCKIHRLAPLGCDEAVTHLIPLEPGQTLEAVQQRRRKRLMALLDAMAPDLVLVEMFPFGRPWFRFEIVPLLEALRGDGVPAVCSVRDVLVRKQDPAAYARQVLEDLDRYFSAVLVHSDPALIRLEETFPAADGIRVPVYYTGYVAGAGHDRHGGFGLDEKTEGNSRSTEQKRPVFRRVARQGLLAWTGSGALGGAVVEAILEAAGQGLLPDKGKARVYAGPALDQAQRSRLNQLARGAAGVVLRTFTNRLRRHLNSARVAVCMAGYMSAVDIMASRTPAVMIPGRQGGEQPFRARKLEEAGYVRVLPLDDLSAHSLARKVEDALGPREEPVRVDLNGARRSAEIVEAIMDGKPLAPSN